MMQDDRITRRLRGAPFPEATPQLRQRVLAAAAAGVQPQVTWADRAWFSPRWRLAALALLVALVGLDRVSVVSRPAGGEGTPAAAVQAAEAVEQSATEVGLPPEQAKTLAHRAWLAANRPAAPRDLWFGLDSQLVPVESGFSRIEHR